MKDVVICIVIGIIGFVIAGVMGDMGFEYTSKSSAVISVIFLVCAAFAYFDKREKDKYGHRLCQSNF